MSKQLYEEALADVKKLKEIAEDNAKKALIEAVSPRIKDLIEAELLKEASDDDEMSDDLLMDDGEEVEIPSAMMPNQQLTIDPSMDAAISSPDEEGKVTLDLDAINVSSSPFDDQFELSNESIRLINPIIEKVNAVTVLKIESKLFKLNESVEKFMDASDATKKTINYQRKILEMVSKIESLYEYLQESAGNLHDKGVYEGKLEKLYKQLNNLAERYNMKNNLKSSLTEAEITLKLTNVPDELEDQLGDLGVDLVSDAGEGDEEEDSAGEEEDSADGEEEDSADGEEEASADGEEELDLGGEEEDSADGEEELDLGGEEEEEETEDEMQKMESRRLNNNTVVEIDENMLRREISRMRTLREADETKPQSWGHGAGDIGDLEDENLGDPLLDIDLSEAQDQEEEVDELDEADYQWDDQQEPARDDENTFGRKPPPGHGPYQGQQNQGQQGQQKQGQQGQQKQGQQGQQKQQGQQMQGHQQDEADEEQEEAQQVQEIRRRLTREAKVQSAAKKKAQSAKKQQREAQQKAKQKQQEVQQKLKQKKQLEAQKAKQEVQKQAKQAKKMQEAYVFYAKIFNESVRRTAKLQTILTENRNVANRNGAATRSTGETLILRKKLTETNLLNTKLLYCNKLLQNESLTKRQKADIIERLDEANSEREVKLVYESLVKTLGSSKTRSLSEGTYRVLGSSSQTTRPASTVLSEGYEAERWAKLAGLK